MCIVFKESSSFPAEIYNASRRVQSFTNKVKKGAQFSGFRTQQFNAIILVILERIEKLKASSIWTEEPEDIIDKIAPMELSCSGEKRIDVEQGKSGFT